MANSLIDRQAAIDEIRKCRFVVDAIERIRGLPSAQLDIAEKLYQCKCCITDQEGLQHEVIYVDDIRRVTGWEI